MLIFAARRLAEVESVLLGWILSSYADDLVI